MFTRVFRAFAKKGFEKATISEIAEAAGVSRQTLYNRHETKEAILVWAAEGFSRLARIRACEALNVPGDSVSSSLQTAFSERIGVLVPLVHGSPHGTEILDLGTKLRKQAPSDFHADFVKELNLFLQSRGVCETLAEAEDLSFLLLTSGKGLLLNTRTREEFDAGMARVIAAVLRERTKRTPGSGRALDAGAEF